MCYFHRREAGPKAGSCNTKACVSEIGRQGILSRRWQLGQELSRASMQSHSLLLYTSGSQPFLVAKPVSGIWDSDCWHKQVHFCRFIIPLSLIQANLWPWCLIGELLHWIILPWRGLATASPIHLEDCRKECLEEQGWCSRGEGSTQRGSPLPAMPWIESSTGAKLGGEWGEETLQIIPSGGAGDSSACFSPGPVWLNHFQVFAAATLKALALPQNYSCSRGK